MKNRQRIFQPAKPTSSTTQSSEVSNEEYKLTEDEKKRYSVQNFYIFKDGKSELVGSVKIEKKPPAVMDQAEYEAMLEEGLFGLKR